MSYNDFMNLKKTSEILKVIERQFQFSFSRQNGSHMIYTRAGFSSLSIPATKQTARGTLRNIAKIVFEKI